MRNIIKQIIKSVCKISLYTVVITVVITVILAVGYFLIPYIVKEHKEPKNFSVVLRDKIYESGLPKDKELDYVIKKYEIKSIVFFNNDISQKSAYLFQYVNNNKLGHFFRPVDNNFLPEYSVVIDYIDFINNEKNQPVLVCSANGEENVDALMVEYRVGCLKWEFKDAISEVRNHYSDKQKEIIKKLAYKIKKDCQTFEPTIINTNNALSFVVLGDASYKVWQETLRSVWRNCVKNKQVPASFVIGVGDMIHSKKLYLLYKKYFTAKKVETPVYLPVLGNHEEGWIDNGDEEEVRDEIIPAIKSAVRYSKTTCNYYLDKENTRLIVIDPYTDFGDGGVINDIGRQWVEKIISSSPTNIQHIFVFFHEPAFPRVRHVGNSFDANRKSRNLFWKMLMRHKDKVRAVFCGHTHHYYKMKIANPESEEANNAKMFPNQKGGIYQIDVGAAGRRHTLNETYVQTIVADNKITVNVFQRRRGTAFSRLEEKLFTKNKYSNMFRITDTFQIYPEVINAN